jgi:serine/threonine-protein kinase PknG
MKCNRPGCPGTIEDDGYCDTCLEEPLTDAPPEPAPPAVIRPAPPPAVPSKPVPSKPVPTKPVAADPVSLETASPDDVPLNTAPLNTGPWWGLQLVPDLAARDAPEPNDVLMTEPSVPAGRWRCRKCNRRVGTAHHGQPGLRKGRCPRCGTPYFPETYAPRLQAGDLVDGRYEVLGCIGQGGVGWVYAAKDRHLNDRWVALKGLIDSAAKETKDAVKAEKNFLLSIDHERIVRIYDSVFHPGHDGLDLYLVMEFIKGYPLAHEKFLTYSQTEIIGCVLQILEAMDYLHRHDYLYCDLKPGNVMLSPSGVKLIDLGAVNSRWSTPDFAAPELPSTGPTVAADLYTVGQTLEVLVERWEPLDQPLASVIAVATRSEPSHRFGSAAAFADQLSGVLSDLTANRPGRLVPSRLFAKGAEALDGGLGVTSLGRWTSSAAQRAAQAGECRRLRVDLPDHVRAAARLPEPYPDPLDPAAGYLTTSLSTDPRTAAGQLDAYVGPTPEILFRRCRVHVSLGELGAARSMLKVLSLEGAGWRRAWLVAWHQGLIALAAGDTTTAAASFAACSAMVPGEAAPRFAGALCAEYQRRFADAERAYRAVWAADRSYEAAVFGLARVLLRHGNRAAAVRTLDQIPGTSPDHQAARAAAIRILSGRLADGFAGLPGPGDLWDASGRLQRGPLGAQERRRLRAEILETALALVRAGITLPDAEPLSAADGAEEIRAKLESAYREFCDQTTDLDDKTILVDLANSVRHTTFR